MAKKMSFLIAERSYAEPGKDIISLNETAVMGLLTMNNFFVVIIASPAYPSLNVQP